jgi:hypothetical protein
MATRKRATARVTDASLSGLARTEDMMLERLVRLEERQTSHIDSTRSNFDATLKRLEEQSNRIEELTSSLNRYKGFWGAVTLLASAIATTFLLLKEYIITRVSN